MAGERLHGPAARPRRVSVARLTELVGEIDLASEPAPFVMSDGMAAAVVARRSSSPYRPEQRLADAEAQAARRLLLRDRLTALRERRQIAAVELRAGRDLAMVEMALDCAGSPQVRTQLRERLAASTGQTLEDSWLHIMEAEHRRYVPWHGWASAFPINRAGATLDQLTGMICTAGLGLRQAADALRQNQARTLRLLRRSLHRYAVIAGWAEGDDPPALDAA